MFKGIVGIFALGVVAVMFGKAVSQGSTAGALVTDSGNAVSAFYKAL